MILTSKDFNEEAFDQKQRERMALIAADQERAMFASREVEKRQRVVATELMQIEKQRRAVQGELRGLQKQQRMVEDEFTEIERQQRAIEGKLLEMQLRQKQVEYETQLKELIYEANTPVGMGYVRGAPRQRSVPRSMGRSATPDTLRSYDSEQYPLERPHSAQVPRRNLPRGGSLQRVDPAPKKIKRSNSLKKLFSSLGRSKDKQKEQYGDVDSSGTMPKKRSGVLRSMKKKMDNATYSFYEAQKPYETVKFKKSESGGATAYSPEGLPPSSSKSSLHGKNNKPGGINIVRTNQQVNAAKQDTPLKITEKKSYMVEESTDYLKKTYLPRDEFAVTSTKAEFDASGGDPSMVAVTEDSVTPRLARKDSREEAVDDALGSLEQKKTLAEQAGDADADKPKRISVAEDVIDPNLVERARPLSVLEDDIQPTTVKKGKEEAVNEAMGTLAEKTKGRPISVAEDSIEPNLVKRGEPPPSTDDENKRMSVQEEVIDPNLVERGRPISVVEDSISPVKFKKEKEQAVQQAMGSLERSPEKGKGVKVVVTTPPADPEVKKAAKAKEARLMKIASGSETPLRQSMDTMESLESMTSDDGKVSEKYKELEASTEAVNDAESEKGKGEEFGKWKVKRMDKVDLDMPSAESEAQAKTEGEKEEKKKESKIAAAIHQGKAKIGGMAAEAKSKVQSARFRPGSKKAEAPAPPAADATSPSAEQPAAAPAEKPAEEPKTEAQQPAETTPAQEQQPAAPAPASIEQVRVTNYDNIDFSDYYRNLRGDGVAVRGAAQSACGDSATDGGVSSSERPPSHYSGVTRAPGMRHKPPISTAGARLLIDSNRNNTVDAAAGWGQDQNKPRSRSADTGLKAKIGLNSNKRAKSAETRAVMKMNQTHSMETSRSEGVMQAQTTNGFQPIAPAPPNTPQKTPESTPSETPKSTPRHTPKMLRRYFQPLRSGSPKKESTPKSTPSVTPQDTPGGSPSSTPKGSRRGTPKALRKVFQPVGTMVQAVRSSWDKHRPRSRSGSRGRSSGSDRSGSREKSPDPFVEPQTPPPGSTAALNGTNSPGTITIDDTVVVLRRDISKRRSEAQKREKRLSRSMDRTPGEETRFPREMQQGPAVRRSQSCDISELDNLDLPYVSMTFAQDRKKRREEMTPLDYNNEYDALIRRMNMLAEVAEHDLRVQQQQQQDPQEQQQHRQMQHPRMQHPQMQHPQMQHTRVQHPQMQQAQIQNQVQQAQILVQPQRIMLYDGTLHHS